MKSGSMYDLLHTKEDISKVIYMKLLPLVFKKQSKGD